MEWPVAVGMLVALRTDLCVQYGRTRLLFRVRHHFFPADLDDSHAVVAAQRLMRVSQMLVRLVVRIEHVKFWPALKMFLMYS